MKNQNNGPPGKSTKTHTLREVVIDSLISPMREFLEAKEAEKKICWVDAGQCPYGYPEGKFTDRPYSFCRLGSCAKITQELIEELIPEHIHWCPFCGR